MLRFAGGHLGVGAGHKPPQVQDTNGSCTHNPSPAPPKSSPTPAPSQSLSPPCPCPALSPKPALPHPQLPPRPPSTNHHLHVPWPHFSPRLPPQCHPRLQLASPLPQPICSSALTHAQSIPLLSLRPPSTTQPGSRNGCPGLRALIARLENEVGSFHCPFQSQQTSFMDYMTLGVKYLAYIGVFHCYEDNVLWNCPSDFLSVEQSLPAGCIARFPSFPSLTGKLERRSGAGNRN